MNTIISFPLFLNLCQREYISFRTFGTDDATLKLTKNYPPFFVIILGEEVTCLFLNRTMEKLSLAVNRSTKNVTSLCNLLRSLEMSVAVDWCERDTETKRTKQSLPFSSVPFCPNLSIFIEPNTKQRQAALSFFQKKTEDNLQQPWLLESSAKGGLSFPLIGIPT